MTSRRKKRSKEKTTRYNKSPSGTLSLNARRKLKLSRERPAEQPFQTAGKHTLSPFCPLFGVSHTPLPLFSFYPLTTSYSSLFLFLSVIENLQSHSSSSAQPHKIDRLLSLPPSTYHPSTYSKTTVLDGLGERARPRRRSPVFGRGTQ